MNNTFKILIFRKHLYKSNTYVFYGFYPHSSDEGKSISCFINKKEVHVTLTINEGNEVRRRYMSMEKNISKEYVGEVHFEGESVKTIEIYTESISTGERSLSYKLSGKKLAEMLPESNNNVKLHMEGAAKDGDKIRIMGWCVCPCSVQLVVKETDQIIDSNIKWSYREDVKGFYPEYDGKTGFEIAIDNKEYENLKIEVYRNLVDNASECTIKCTDKCVTETELSSNEALEKANKAFEKATIPENVSGEILLFAEKLDASVVNSGGPFSHKLSYKDRIQNYIYMNGTKAAIKRVFTKLKGVENPYTYADFLEAFGTKTEELELQRKDNSLSDVSFSIVVPMYNTKPEYLRALIKSIVDQTYSNWELCLADGSESNNEALISSVCKELKINYVKIDDERIIPDIESLDTELSEDNKNNHKGTLENDLSDNLKDEMTFKTQTVKYLHLFENKGIAENTNAAVAMAAGEYLVFADHDDLLAPEALYQNAKIITLNTDTDMIYSDEDKVTMDGKEYFDPAFKPDFSIDYLCSVNYICHLLVVSKQLVLTVSEQRQAENNETCCACSDAEATTVEKNCHAFDAAYDGAQDHDFVLRCAENAKHIEHIPKILYHWRAHNDSTAMAASSKMYAYENGAKAVTDHFKRIGVPAVAEPYEFLGTYKTNYNWTDETKVSIIIPNKDNVKVLSACIDSIQKNNAYRNYEIIIVENNSTESETFEYYSSLLHGNYDKDKLVCRDTCSKPYSETNNEINNSLIESSKKAFGEVLIVNYQGTFNYSAINNLGAQHSTGDYLLLLNNDITVINSDAIKQMVDVCRREDIGAVGAELFYPDDTVQHGGIIMGVGGIAGHSFVTFKRGEPGYMFRLALPNNVSACTAAALMVKKKAFEEVNGLTEDLSVAFNDVDFCLKLRKAGYLIVYNPFAMFYHYESASRGMENTIEKRERFNREIEYLENHWNEILTEGDPYYSPNLSLKNGSYLLKE